MYIVLLLQVPYSIPSVGDYYGEYSLHCNFPGGKFFAGVVSHCLPLKDRIIVGQINICTEFGLNPR